MPQPVPYDMFPEEMAPILEHMAQTLPEGVSIGEFAPMLSLDNFRKAPTFENRAQVALLRPNPQLEHALSNSTAKGLPPISVSPLSGQHLTILTRLMGAKSVLEMGTLGGYSSICFAKGGAKVTSIEIDPKHRDVAMENTKGLDVEVILGAALDVVPKLAEDGKKFDMVFIDTNFEGQYEMFDWAIKLTRKGGCVILEDVVFGMLMQGQAEEGKDSPIEMIGKDDRVTATFMPTVASHSMFPTPVFNGYMLAVVN